ncbi:MAG: choice-of-anchor L domain-containing protein [Bacteroidota bacterium]
MKKLILSTAVLFSTVSFIYSQVVTVPDTNVSYYVNSVLLGNYVSATNINSTCVFGAINSLGEFAGFDTIGIDAGIIMSTGDVFLADDPNVSGSAGNVTNSGGDSLLGTLIPGYPINDAAIIEFDFIPYTNLLTFSYVFASEEYPEWVNSSYNDVFGFFISGANPDTSLPAYSNENIALVPGTLIPVTIDNVNGGNYSQYYIDNTIGSAGIQYDGYTTPLDAFAHVIPFQTYHIKLAIGDAGDSAYDSAVFLKNDSFSSVPLQYTSSTNISVKAFDDAIEDSLSVDITITLPEVAQGDISYSYSIGGTADNGIDYETISNIVTFTKGSSSAVITIDPISDALNEGSETVILIMDYLNDTISVNILDYISVNIDNNYAERSLKIYPNPSKGNITVEADGLQDVEIVRVTGEILKQYTIYNSQNTVQIEDLAKGIYFVKVISEKGVSVEKVIVE